MSTVFGTFACRTVIPTATGHAAGAATAGAADPAATPGTGTVPTGSYETRL